MLAITLNNIFSLPFRCIWQAQEVTENLHRQTQEVLHISLAVNYLFAYVNSLFNPALSQHFSVILVVLKLRGTFFSDGAQNHWTWSPDNYMKNMNRNCHEWTR